MIEVYYFNCRSCGAPLLYHSPTLTESARKSGYCVECALTQLSDENERVTLIVSRPTPEARLN